MNDFTKDELLAMAQTLRMASKSGFETDDNLPTAYHCYDKIQSLIDNYCEHEWENTCCACSMTALYCHKCGKDGSELKERYEKEH